MSKSLSRIGLFALALLAFSACAPAPRLVQGLGENPPTPEAVRGAYHAAIHAAAVVDASAVRPLRPVASDPVRVVTLTSYPYSLGKTSLNVDVWVTLVPEVRDICQGFGDDLELRVKQLIGLMPSKTYTHFVEMSVPKASLFRPCADPAVDTTTCPLEFPAAPSEHTNWMGRNALSSYKTPAGYPWTRLGYTYNWRPGASDRYGATEYVVKAGSAVEVLSITETRVYCTAN